MALEIGNSYQLRPLTCDPVQLSGLSEKLIKCISTASAMAAPWWANWLKRSNAISAASRAGARNSQAFSSALHNAAARFVHTQSNSSRLMGDEG